MDAANNNARRERLISALIVIAACAVAALPLWVGPGLVNTRAGGDSPFLLVRTFELAENLRAGIFPARWMPNAAYGFGYPFFYFYAALPYYLAAGLTVAGVDLLVAIKLTQTLGFFAAAAAMFWLARRWLSRTGAVVAACAYTFMPFHLVNVYVRGDSLSEFWAFVWFPLILGGVAAVVAGQRGATGLLALALAALALTHNVSTLIFAPLAAIWALGLVGITLSDWRTRLRRFGSLLLAAGLGLALSAWFWLPALALMPQVQLDDQTSGYFHYTNHFRALDLVQSSFFFDYSLADGRRAFAMGLVPSVLIMLGIFAGALSLARAEQKGAWALMVVLFALSTFMIAPLSAPVWETLKPLQWAQFPWRWLAAQSAFAALLIGGIGGAPRMALRAAVARVGALVSVRSTLVSLPTSWWRRFAGLVFVLMLGWSALARLPNARLDVRAEDVNAYSVQLYEWFSGNIGTTIRAEYLPVVVQPRPYTGFAVLGRTPRALPLEDAPLDAVASERVLHTPNVQTWRVRLTRPLSVALPMFALPGATLRINDAPPQAVSFAPSGWVQVRLEAGEHTVSVQRAPLPLEQWANALSGATALAMALAGLGSLIAQPRAQRQRKLVRLALVCVLCVLGVIGLTLLRPPPEAPPLQALDFDQRPFVHRGPIHFVEGSTPYTLVGAAITPTVLQPGAPFTLTLRWQDDRAPAGITVTQELPMGGAFLNVFRYAREQRAADPRQSQHRLLDAALPSPLLILVQAHDTEGRLLPTFTNDGAELRVPLAGGFTSGALLHVGTVVAPESPRVPFTNSERALHLVALDWFLPSHHEACFRPTWRWAADRLPYGEAWQFSFRLRDASGQLRVQADAQPQGGLVPTWAWLPGVRVPDSYCARAERGIDLPHGASYSLEIVWYRLATREEIGRARFQGKSEGVGGLHVLLP
ncbi:MAG: YfhO family protein [Thermoflexales bacterium]|nr:YfhO family protein [Thermoflexales bacterium]